LTHSEVREAAKAIDVRHETLNRWMGIPSFKEAYAQARRAALDTTIDQLRAASSEAVQALRRNLQCGDAGTENTAAKAILELLLKQGDGASAPKGTPVQIQVVYSPAMQVNINEPQDN